MIHLKRVLAASTVVFSLGGVVGCGGGYIEEPVDSAEVTSAPVDIETYPSVMYEGQPVYFYRDRWWYHGGGGRWTYYQREPAELHRQRATVVHARPRARTVVARPAGERPAGERPEERR